MRGTGCGVTFSLLFALAGCGSDGSGETVVYTLAPVRERPVGTLEWEPCGNVECATLDVPIDHQDASLGTLSLALNRVRSSAEVGYRGAVLVNPGGPGASGKAYVALSAEALRRFLPGFDFIGFDPRGIGDSAALDCEFAGNPVRTLALEGSGGYLSEIEQTSRDCAARVGALFDNLGSNQVVADIERMREALEEEEINFIGISYGTRLGELYALQYPEHARAVVLDGPLPVVADLRRLTESQFVALLALHREFFEDCAAGVLRCPAEPEAVFQDMVEAGASLSPMLQFALSNWKFLLGSVPGRELAAQSLRVHVGEEPPPEMMAGMAAAAAVVPSFNLAANLSTNCADDINPPLTPAAADQLVLTYLRRSQVFALEAAPALTCSAWDVQRDPLPSLEFEPRVPPLVIGGTRDILTPYVHAQETVRAIDGATLLTSEHYGHSALNLGLPSCVMGHVLRYLETLEPPPAGSRCAAPPPAP